MNELFDTRQVRRAFSRAAPGYDAAAALQRRVEAHLLDSLEHHVKRVGADAPPPQRVLDLGSGPGRAAAALRERWPKAEVLAFDLALPMLQQARRQAGWHPLRRGIVRVCADARALPLADNSLDVLFTNLCVQWVADLPAVLTGFRRALRPGGVLLLSTFGPETLIELREAFAEADAQAPHVSPFAAMTQVGDALLLGGFRDPVLDREVSVSRYRDLPALMRELRALGATNALRERRRTLTGKARFARAAEAYARAYGGADGLPATWETITAIAWAPEAGAPIRERGGAEIASFPAGRIPIRKR